MNRSHLLTELRNLVRAARVARESRLSLSEVVGRITEHRSQRTAPTRRQFVIGVGAAAGAGILLNSRPARATQQPSPRIAIVGGGIAGLNAALTLQDAGFGSTIYEASPFIGGRIHSNTTTWLDNQTSEWCGEFIDSGHTTMRRLARRFGLRLADVIAAQPAGSADTLYFFEKHYGVEQASNDFQAIATRLEFDANRLFPTSFDPATHLPRAVQLDNMSAWQWIENYVPGGHGSPLGAYIDSAYTNEFGLDTHLQSSLNIVYEMGFQPGRSNFSIYGESDQRFHVRGGNDQIPKAIAAALPEGNINTEWWMESIAKQSDGTYSLTFSTRNGARWVTADHVILTLPFSVLRGLDYRNAGFDAMKQTAITQLGYGTNSKLILQCSDRLWDEQGPWGLGDGTIYGPVLSEHMGLVSRHPRKGGRVSRVYGRCGWRVTRGGTNALRGREHLARGSALRSTVSERREASVARHRLALEWQGDALGSLESSQPARQLFLLAGRSVHEICRLRRSTPGQLPLRRRALLHKLPGLYGRRRPGGCTRGAGDHL
jgi:monoamine oxidase